MQSFLASSKYVLYMIENTLNSDEARKGKNLIVQEIMKRTKDALREYAGDDAANKVLPNDLQRKAVEMISGMDFSNCRTKKDAENQVRTFWSSDIIREIAAKIYHTDLD